MTDVVVEAPQANSRFVSKVSSATSGPAMNIPAVPDHIDRQTVLDILAGLGIDPHQLTRDGVHIGWNSVQCTVYATNAKGHRFIDTGRNNEIATHRISIPIHDPEKDGS